jgi:hypothetical protein
MSKKRVDVRDVKKERSSSVICLLPSLEILPNHWKMSGGHSQGHGEGHGAHPDCVGAADMMAAFIASSDTLGTLLF